ncbi:hypothetical protein MGYG_05949 [Nannizzia gypsea CBS 118893]|uniref:Uncharacterized protein n=1 Tax=Arthroderma gypseum (strain ATCC MYA-4604 / CBS 118893) TaxID=535722 RepID=E4V012_ARTGP|nr:hypothetical protein MGYG_05949 [Nannizzia gypsea CBS 118893]EFR02949.1 hypothetical protein MGYG_05949 [Nannizzia gypsea CBS 118893]
MDIPASTRTPKNHVWIMSCFGKHSASTKSYLRVRTWIRDRLSVRNNITFKMAYSFAIFEPTLGAGTTYHERMISTEREARLFMPGEGEGPIQYSLVDRVSDPLDPMLFHSF